MRHTYPNTTQHNTTQHNTVQHNTFSNIRQLDEAENGKETAHADSESLFNSADSVLESEHQEKGHRQVTKASSSLGLRSTKGKGEPKADTAVFSASSVLDSSADGLSFFGGSKATKGDSFDIFADAKPAAAKTGAKKKSATVASSSSSSGGGDIFADIVGGGEKTGTGGGGGLFDF